MSEGLEDFQSRPTADAKRYDRDIGTGELRANIGNPAGDEDRRRPVLVLHPR